MSLGKVLAVVGGVAVLGVAAALSGVFNPQFSDSGVDVRGTRCEELASARQAILNELEERKNTAAQTHEQERDGISEAYWEKNRELEAKNHECISRALTADPCKEAFDRGERLYEEIMADFAADKGFNEAKFNEREAAKKEYNACVEEARKPETYTSAEAACAAELAAGREANQADRTTKEARARARYDEMIARAQEAYQQKSAILDAIKEKCNEPGDTVTMRIGGLTTAGSGTSIQSQGSACTGAFAGNDPDIQRQIARLESQLQKAKAGGQSGGLFGVEHIQESLDRLRQELRDSERTCVVDADCGDPTPVCCSGTQVGRAYCNNGVCASEKRECVDPEICAGKPAACVAPSTGAQQQDGVYISRTIPETGSCSQNLQVLKLQKATPESSRFSIAGNIPGWLHIDPPSGSLPGTVDVTYSCGTVQAMGPGVYTAGGSMTVYNAANELINTVPFNVVITVTAAPKMIDVIDVGGKLIPVSDVHRFTGPECDKDEHWHANSGSARALDGSVVPDVSECGYGKTKNIPVISAPDTRVRGEVRGLEGLKSR